MIDWIYGLNPAGVMHLFFFGLLVPLGALQSRRRIAASGVPDRMLHFRATVLNLVLFGAVSVFTAWGQGINLTRFDAMKALQALPVAVAMYAVAVALMRPRWRHAVEKKGRLAHLFMPQTHSERRWWILLSVLAGISEEITWRGVQPVLLTALIGNPSVAAVGCAAMFGAAHAVQGWRSAVITVGFALAFQLIVWISGSLVVAAAAHAAYDITAGLAYGRLGSETGYKVEDCGPM